MAEGEISEKGVIRKKCGSDAPHPNRNGTGMEDQVSDTDNFHVSVSGAVVVGNKDVAVDDLAASPRSEFKGSPSDGAVIKNVGGAVKEGEFGDFVRTEAVSSLMSDRTWNHENAPFNRDLATTEGFGDENGNIVNGAKNESYEKGDLDISEIPSGPLENQEKVVSVVESSENVDFLLDDLPLQSNMAGECNGGSDLWSTETLESCQGLEKEAEEVVGICQHKDVVGDMIHSEPSCGTVEYKVSLNGELASNPDSVEAVGLGTNPSLDNGSADAASKRGFLFNSDAFQTVEACRGSQEIDDEMMQHKSKDRKSNEVNLVSEVVENSVQEENLNNLAKSGDHPGSSVHQVSDAEISELPAEFGKNGEVNAFQAQNADCDLSDQPNLDGYLSLASGQEYQGDVLDASQIELNGELAEITEYDVPVEHLEESECLSGNQEIRVQASDLTPGTSDACNGSLEVAGDLAAFGLQDVPAGAEDEHQLESKLVETREPKVPTLIQLDADPDTCPNIDHESTIEGATSASSPLEPENHRCDDVATSLDIQDVPENIYETKPADHMETDRDLVIQEHGKEKEEGLSAYHGTRDAEIYDETVVQTNGDVGVPHETMKSGIMTSPVEKISNHVVNGYAPPAEGKILFLEAVLNGTKQGTREKGPIGNGFIRFSSNEAKRESDSVRNAVVVPSLDPLSRDNLAENFPTIYESYPQAEIAVIKSRSAKAARATTNLKSEPEINDENLSSSGSSENTGEDHSLPYEKEGGVELERHEVEDKGDQFEDSNGSSNMKVLFPESGKTDIQHTEKVSEVSSEGSSKDMTDTEARTHTEIKPFNFLVRIPRSDDESIREEVNLAKVHVDEKTMLRDAIRVQIQQKRDNIKLLSMRYDYAKDEARNARKEVKQKRMQIDSLNSVINKAKNALSIEDIDTQIRNMENMIQHETLHLKEEKMLIRDIKQLKQLREQLSSNLGNQDEIKQALEQREDVVERLKILRKELDFLKDRALKAEAAAVEAGKKYEHENKEIKELQSQFRAADDVRQAAYAQFQSCRKDQSKKNQLFFKYKNDASVAANYGYSGNSQAVYRLCSDQVNNFMDMWNTNEEFRKEYVQLNSKSTVRRFGTFDGRSLGPDEKPVVIPISVVDGANRVLPKPVNSDRGSVISTSDSRQEMIRVTVDSVGKSTKNVSDQKHQKVARPVRVNERHSEANNEASEEPVISKEEVDALRKAEEKRNEEAEAQLKEQKRLEELAKANEARERKKRQLEKSQMREQLKTQKEAEQKEREREKRQRKKDRKKAAPTENRENISTSEASSSHVEICKEIETKDSSVTPRKPNKPWLFSKHSKAKSVPPPLRNKNRKKWQQWTWVAIACLVILFVFWLGNIGFFTNVNLKR